MAIYPPTDFTGYNAPVTPPGEVRNTPALGEAFFDGLTQAVRDSAPRFTRLAVATTGTPVPLDGQMGRYDTTSGDITVELGNQPVGAIVAVAKTVAANTLYVVGTSFILVLAGEVREFVSLGGGTWQALSSSSPITTLQAYLDERYDARYTQTAPAALTGILARGSRTTSPATTTATSRASGRPALEVNAAGVPVTAGRAYLVTASASVYGPASGANAIGLALTYVFAETGTPGQPGMGSTLLRDTPAGTPGDALGDDRTIQGLYVPSATGKVRFLFGFYAATTGTYGMVGSSTTPILLRVDDLGAAPAESGVSR